MPIVNASNTRHDVYVGICGPWANPFNHHDHSTVIPYDGNPSNNSYMIKVETREEANACFEMWLKGEAFEEVFPERRAFILENLHTLKGKVLGSNSWPLECSAAVLERMANES